MNTLKRLFFSRNANLLACVAAALCAQPTLCAGLGCSDDLTPGAPWGPGLNGANGAAACAMAGQVASNNLAINDTSSLKGGGNCRVSFVPFS